MHRHKADHNSKRSIVERWLWKHPLWAAALMIGACLLAFLPLSARITAFVVWIALILCSPKE